MPPGSNDIKLALNEKQFGLGRELEENGEEKRILMNLHVRRMINDHLLPSLKRENIGNKSRPRKPVNPPRK
jgi:hypothetical protein